MYVTLIFSFLTCEITLQRLGCILQLNVCYNRKYTLKPTCLAQLEECLTSKWGCMFKPMSEDD